MDDCPTPSVSLKLMENPTLFDSSHPSIEGSLAGDARSAQAGDRQRAQARIRQLNEDRLARQDDEQRDARRRAAVARLRRAVSTADEVDAEYWELRRATLQLVG